MLSSDTPDARRSAEILAERARALARPLARPTTGPRDRTAGDGAGTLDAIVVRAGVATFALPLDDVVEVLRATRLTPLPGAAPPIVGVVPWRGRVLAVRSLGGPVPNNSAPPNGADGDAQNARSAQRVVVAGDARSPIALVVDEVEAVRQVTVLTASDDAARPDAVPTRGVTPDAIAVLDLAALDRRAAAEANDS